MKITRIVSNDHNKHIKAHTAGKSTSSKKKNNNMMGLFHLFVSLSLRKKARFLCQNELELIRQNFKTLRIVNSYENITDR